MNHDLLLEKGISLKRRRIFLSGEIENGKSDVIIRSLLLMADIGKEDITLVINSLGGDLYDTFAIYDIMKSIPNQIRTISVGKCQSAAPLILAAGAPNKRFSFPNCHFMVHDIWTEGPPDATVEAARRELRHTTELRKRYIELMGRNTKIAATDWKKICRRPGDSFFGVEKALQYGIIDSIITTDDIWESYNDKKE